jgi:hypothetical protein
MKVTLGSMFLVPALAGPVALTTACGGTTEPPESSSPTHLDGATAAPYDGQTVFRAVFFNSGPAAERVAPVWAQRPALMAGKSGDEVATLLEHAADEMSHLGYSSASVALMQSQANALRGASAPLTSLRSSASIDAVADAIVAHISSTDPDFFGSFGIDMQSGNALRVQGALATGAKELLEAHAALTASTVSTDSLILGPIRPIAPIRPITPIAPGGPIRGDDLIVVDIAVAIYAVAVVAVFVAVAAAPGAGGSPIESEVAVGQLTSAFAY